MDTLLIEKWQPLVESKKAKPVKNVEAMTQLLENQEQWMLTEAGSSTSLGDIAQYTPILVPAVRRVFPNLLANEIVGVQPMTSPTSYAFAIRYGYEVAGATAPAKNNINGSAIDYPGTPSTGALDGVGRLQKNSQEFNSYAIVLKGNIPAAVGAAITVDENGATAGGVTTCGTVALRKFDLGQNITKILVQCAVNSATENSVVVKTALTNAIAAADAQLTIAGVGGAVYEIGTTSTTLTVLGFFNNEAGYNLVFGSEYISYLNTADGEYLARTDMKSMKMSVERFSVTAQTRKYKAEYSMELAQDLKAVHGLDAEAELINIVEYEVAAELDRDLVEAIHQNCTNAGSWFYGNPGQMNSTEGSTAPSQTADGRWEMEKFRSLYTRIVREANAVALQTRRGPANFIIASLNVVSALETLSNFMYSAVPGNVEAQIGVAKVGTLDGRFSVYLDTFAYTDFVIVGYKGTSAFDTGIIYCPYVPLQIIKVTDPNTFQPAIGFQSRDAILGNLWGAEKYYRKFLCDFTGSSFISSTYYF